jgi:hypothetical protein
MDVFVSSPLVWDRFRTLTRESGFWVRGGQIINGGVDPRNKGTAQIAAKISFKSFWAVRHAPNADFLILRPTQGS